MSFCERRCFDAMLLIHSLSICIDLLRNFLIGNLRQTMTSLRFAFACFELRSSLCYRAEFLFSFFYSVSHFHFVFSLFEFDKFRYCVTFVLLVMICTGDAFPLIT